MKAIKIIDAKYLDDYKIQLTFNDTQSKIIDFFDLLSSTQYMNEKKYFDKNQFQQFRIDLGDLIWNDYDMCFQAKNLYKGILRK